MTKIHGTKRLAIASSLAVATAFMLPAGFAGSAWAGAGAKDLGRMGESGPSPGGLQAVVFDRANADKDAEGQMKVVGQIKAVDWDKRTITLDNGESYVLTKTEPSLEEKLVPDERIAFFFNTEGNQNLIVSTPLVGDDVDDRVD